MTQAQGTLTYLSNLGQTSIGNNPVGSNSWLAAGFITGYNTEGYVLNSVQLEMTGASGNPSGFRVMVYIQNLFAIVPGNIVGTLAGSTDQAIGGFYTYTPTSNIILYPNIYYFIVITAGTAVANGSYNPSGDWGGGIGHVATSGNGSSWFGTPAGYAQFAITATPIPEPSPSLLLLLGSGVFIYIRRIKKHSRTLPTMCR
jgi:hypothetical protein